MSMDESKVASLVEFAAGVMVNSNGLESTDQRVMQKIFAFLDGMGIPVTKIEIEEVTRQTRNLIPALTAAGARKPLNVQQLISIAAKLPENTPVLYQRMEDKYFSELNWSIGRFLFDASYEMDYMAACSWHVGHDHSGNIALCINLMNQAVGLSAFTPHQPDLLSTPNATLEETYLPYVRKTLEENEGFISMPESMMHIARMYLSETGIERYGRHSLYVIAHQLSVMQNKVVYPCWSFSSDDYLQTGALTKKLQGLPHDMPVFCQRIVDDCFRKTYTLSWQKAQSQYFDIWDCQITKGPEGYMAACLNAHF